MNRMVSRLGMFGLLAFLLSGCGAAGVVATGASLATTINTDRTVIDHLSSSITGQYCSTMHVTRDNAEYCQDPVDPEARALEAAAQYPHCYRTLGTITCYDRADPYQNNETPIR